MNIFWNNLHQVLSVKRLDLNNLQKVRSVKRLDLNNLQQVHSVKRLESQIIYKSLVARKPKGLNRIAKIQLFRIMSIPTTFRLFLVLTSEQIGRRLPVFTLLLWQRQYIIVVDAVDYISNCNMETPRKPLNKYWCSVPHYLSDIRNIYIKADVFIWWCWQPQIKKENKFNFKEVFVSALKSLIQIK